MALLSVVRGRGNRLSTNLRVAWWIRSSPRTGMFPYEYCIQCRDEVAEAVRKVVASGVSSYHVGSRGLTRLTLAELQDLLAFWINAANDAALGIASSIQTRRGVPCDV